METCTATKEPPAFNPAELRRQLDGKAFVYDDGEGCIERTWSVPFTHKNRRHTLEVFETNGLYGIHWTRANRAVSEALSVRVTDVMGRLMWQQTRSDALFAKYPEIPAKEWLRTKPVDMSPEWLAFREVYQEHMYDSEEARREEPPYRNFWHRVLDGPFERSKFKKDAFNVWPVSFYDTTAPFWARNPCYHPLVELHREIADYIAQLFPEVRCNNGKGIRYWVYW